MDRIRDQIRKNQKTIFAVLGVVFICLLLLGATLMILNNQSSKVSKDFYPILATPTAFGEARVMATPALVQTPMPTTISSAEWKVSKILEPVKIGQFTYAIVEFKNIGNGETKTGQCQQPGWPMPEIGHIYRLTNTYRDYWLFIPIEGIESEYQRFAPLD